MLHRLIARIASLALVAGLLAVPAAANAKHHATRHHARHHLVKKTRSVVKSAGRVEGGTIGEPTHNEPSEPAPTEPPHEDPPPVDPPQEPAPPAPPVEQPKDAGVVASYGEGVLNIELTTDGHVAGKVGPGTQFSCRSASTNAPVTEGCNASLLTNGRHVHEFTVNYGPEGAWFARLIFVLP